MSDERQSARPDAESEAATPPARTAQVRALFEAALEVSASHRREFLLAQCPDESIRREVESLLEHDAQASEDFLVPDETPSRLGADSHSQRSLHAHVLPGAEGVDRLIGCRIASYTIRRLIAEGGMGAVYLAEQDRPRREVALKVMTDGFWSRSARRRFEFETEILGRLHHPNIAQVYEAGVADVLPLPPGEGRREGKTPLERESLLVPHPDLPSLERESTLERESLLVPPPAPIARVHYFALEYIPDARPIAAFCEQESLGLSDRLRLFRVVCDAVHYGHQNGVIHRDLKPDNILIDARGHVKIIDFGVARSTDCDVAATMHTEAGQLIGTLAYMSPEQCAADPQAIDTRSDVYSLGTVLFELLTGGLPYDVSHLSVPSATRVICEQPPARPSDVAARISANRRAVAHPLRHSRAGGNPDASRGTGLHPVKSPDAFDSRRFVILANRIRGDLDTIILKCLEKDRNKRYHSAAALSDDIERYLRREPISARPPTRWTNGVRWASRHPVLATVTSCVLFAVATLTATMLSVWHLKSRPDHIVRFRYGVPIPKDEPHSRADDARLMSRAGNELHRWGGDVGSIAFAALIARPQRFGGGQLAAVGYAGPDSGPYAKSLCVYDVGADRNRTLWQRKIQQGEVLAKLVEKRPIGADSFAPCVGIVADVFPGDDYPGDELVVTFGTQFSQRIIRIYDLRGAVLFEAWHDGSAGWCEWLCDAGTLIFAGDDHHCGWDDEGNATTPAPAPLVVFAIRPTPHSINRLDYFNSNENLALLATGRGPPWLSWYKWVYAGNDGPFRIGEHSLALRKPTRGDPRRIVQLGIRLNYLSEIASISWEIDESGNELPGARTPDESYKRALAAGARLPDPYSFHLLDVPPDETPRVAATSQSGNVAASTQPAATAEPP